MTGQHDRGQGNFWKGFLGFGIPLVLVSVLYGAGSLRIEQLFPFHLVPPPRPLTRGACEAVGQLIYPMALLWFAGALLWIAALVAMFIFYATGRPRTGTGTLAALAIGLLGLYTSCFANPVQTTIEHIVFSEYGCRGYP